MPRVRGATSCRPRSIRCCTRPAPRSPSWTWWSAACKEGESSVFVSGIDPGWALDILPALVSGVSAGIEEIRVQEIFNYALVRPARRGARGHRLRRADGRDAADAPRLLARHGVGADGADPGRPPRREARRGSRPTSSGGRWSARSRCRAWARSSRAPRARSGSRCVASSTAVPLLVVEHVTRIDDECAPEWPTSHVTRRRAPASASPGTRTSRSRSTAPSPESRVRRAAGTRRLRTAS